MDTEDEREIAAFREEIDEIDLQLLDLLNRRAACAIGIGKVKKRNNQPVFVPDREKAVVERVSARNAGPLPHGSVRTIFRTIFAQMKKLEESIE